MSSLLEKGIEEFNRQYFFEAHDLWEELWVGTVGHKRLFYQGLIQTAVGFYHLSNKNYKGACSQFEKACRKLEEYSPVCEGIATSQLLASIQQCLGEARALRSGDKVDFDNTLIPTIQQTIT